jgi:hypothetical protein
MNQRQRRPEIMSVYTGNLTGIAPGARKRNRSGEKKRILLFLICYFVPFLIATFCAFTYWVKQRAGIEEMNRSCVRLQADIHLLDREILNQKVERERLGSWKHIGRMIQKMKLPLVSANPYQVSNLNAPASTTAIQAVARRAGTGAVRDPVKTSNRKVR